jgi:hypothetical protein
MTVREEQATAFRSHRAGADEAVDSFAASEDGTQIRRRRHAVVGVEEGVEDRGRCRNHRAILLGGGDIDLAA